MCNISGKETEKHIGEGSTLPIMKHICNLKKSQKTFHEGNQ